MWPEMEMLWILGFAQLFVLINIQGCTSSVLAHSLPNCEKIKNLSGQLCKIAEELKQTSCMQPPKDDNVPQNICPAAILQSQTIQPTRPDYILPRIPANQPCDVQIGPGLTSSVLQFSPQNKMVDKDCSQFARVTVEKSNKITYNGPYSNGLLDSEIKPQSYHMSFGVVHTPTKVAHHADSQRYQTLYQNPAPMTNNQIQMQNSEFCSDHSQYPYDLTKTAPFSSTFVKPWNVIPPDATAAPRQQEGSNVYGNIQCIPGTQPVGSCCRISSLEKPVDTENSTPKLNPDTEQQSFATGENSQNPELDTSSNLKIVKQEQSDMKETTINQPLSGSSYPYPIAYKRAADIKNCKGVISHDPASEACAEPVQENVGAAVANAPVTMERNIEKPEQNSQAKLFNVETKEEPEIFRPDSNLSSQSTPNPENILIHTASATERSTEDVIVMNNSDFVQTHSDEPDTTANSAIPTECQEVVSAGDSIPIVSDIHSCSTGIATDPTISSLGDSNTHQEADSTSSTSETISMPVSLDLSESHSANHPDSQSSTHSEIPLSSNPASESSTFTQSPLSSHPASQPSTLPESSSSSHPAPQSSTSKGVSTPDESNIRDSSSDAIINPSRPSVSQGPPPISLSGPTPAEKTIENEDRQLDDGFISSSSNDRTKVLEKSAEPDLIQSKLLPSPDVTERLHDSATEIQSDATLNRSNNEVEEPTSERVGSANSNLASENHLQKMISIEGHKKMSIERFLHICYATLCNPEEAIVLIQGEHRMTLKDVLLNSKGLSAKAMKTGTVITDIGVVMPLNEMIPICTIAKAIKDMTASSKTTTQAKELDIVAQNIMNIMKKDSDLHAVHSSGTLEKIKHALRLFKQCNKVLVVFPNGKKVPYFSHKAIIDSLPENMKSHLLVTFDNISMHYKQFNAIMGSKLPQSNTGIDGLFHWSFPGAASQESDKSLAYNHISGPDPSKWGFKDHAYDMGCRGFICASPCLFPCYFNVHQPLHDHLFYSK